MFLNNFSSAATHCSLNDGRAGGQKPHLLLRPKKASIRCWTTSVNKRCNNNNNNYYYYCCLTPRSLVLPSYTRKSPHCLFVRLVFWPINMNNFSCLDQISSVWTGLFCLSSCTKIQKMQKIIERYKLHEGILPTNRQQTDRHSSW